MFCQLEFSFSNHAFRPFPGFVSSRLARAIGSRIWQVELEQAVSEGGIRQWLGLGVDSGKLHSRCVFVEGRNMSMIGLS